MPDFSNSFIESKGNPLNVNGTTVFMGDYIPFKNGDRFLIKFEKTNSEWRQGLLLSLWGYFEIDGEKFNNRIILWEDTFPEIIITIFQSNSSKQPKRLPKKGILGIRNAWDSGTGRIDSWFGGAAMIIEEIDHGRRYRCNDGHPDDNFDDIVFTIQRI